MQRTEDSSLQAVLYIDGAQPQPPVRRPPNRRWLVLLCGAVVLALAAALRLGLVHQLLPTPPVAVQTVQPKPQATPSVTPSPQRTASARVAHLQTVRPVFRPTVMQSPHVAASPRVPASPKPTPKSHLALTPKSLARRQPTVVHRTVVHVAPPAPVAVHAVVVPRVVRASDAEPVITRFFVAPDHIVAGATATVCVLAQHASQLALSGIGEVNAQYLSCRRVHPAASTVYTAWAVNPLGTTVTQSVKLTVAP